MMKRIFILCSAVILLAGCHIYKPYSRPDIQTDGLYGEDVQAEDTVSIASLPWTELFSDLRLQSLIREGLENNADLGIARLRVKEAEAALFSSRLAYLPSLSLNPQGQLNSYDHTKTDKTYTIAASAGWEVDLFGKLTNAKRGAKAALEQSDAYRQAVQTQLIATIANSYYNLLTLDRQLDISRRTAGSWAEVFRTYEAKKRVGEATEAAVAQAKANKLAVEASVLTLQKQIRAQENTLSALLGRTPGRIERTTLKGQCFPDRLSVGVPLQLLRRRPDVRQAEAALAQAFYSTNGARSAFYPGITLSGSAGWTNSGGGAIVNPGAWLLQAVGSLVQPLFNRGQNIANLRIAKAQQEIAQLNFEQALLNAGQEVSNALSTYQTATLQAQSRQKQVSELEKAVESTNYLFQHDPSTTYLETLTAQQSLLDAQLNLISDKFDKVQAAISLYQALGGGRN